MFKFTLGNLIFNFKNISKNNFYIRLKEQTLANKHPKSKILVLGTGKNLILKKEKILKFIEDNQPIVIACNNVLNDFDIDYRIFTNRSRFANYSNLIKKNQKIIISPYFKKKFIKKYINSLQYSYVYFKIKPKISSSFMIKKNIISFQKIPNVGFISILLASIMGAENIYIAGLDGYSKSNINYYHEKDQHDLEYLINQEVYLKKLANDINFYLNNKNIDITSITSSKYFNN